MGLILGPILAIPTVVEFGSSKFTMNKFRSLVADLKKMGLVEIYVRCLNFIYMFWLPSKAVGLLIDSSIEPEDILGQPSPDNAVSAILLFVLIILIQVIFFALVAVLAGWIALQFSAFMHYALAPVCLLLTLLIFSSFSLSLWVAALIHPVWALVIFAAVIFTPG